MPSLRQSAILALSVALGVGITVSTLPGQPASAEPILISQYQSLPPMQGGGNGSFNTYGNQGNYNNNYGSNNYNNNTGYNNNYNNGYNSSQGLQGYVATAPAGTSIPVSITSPISSEFARVGDRFTVNLSSPLAAGGSVLLPAGSQVEGQVVMVKPAGRTGRNGELEVRFSSGIMPNGQRVPLSARIQTEDNTGILKGGTNKGRLGRAALSTGVGSGLGAALGTAMGPLSGGGVGRGAIYGTALGAGVGALGSAWQKGKPAVLDTSQPVNIVLDQPLTVSPSQDNGNYAPQQNYNQNYNNQYNSNY